VVGFDRTEVFTHHSFLTNCNKHTRRNVGSIIPGMVKMQQNIMKGSRSETSGQA